MLSEWTVLGHMDHATAANPAASGRPLELFIGASDCGWSATATQRPEPNGPPKVISLITKGVADFQQRWPAMERKLCASLQGVIGPEHLVKGMKIFVA
jgi:hypothetical protein